MLFTSAISGGTISIATTFFLSSSSSPESRIRFRTQSHFQPLLHSSTSSSVHSDTLRVLEWDKVCDCVASFAGTPLGRDATKERLWSLDVGSYEESKRLLKETSAVVQMIQCGVGGLDFNGINVASVKSAVESALRGFPLSGREALAVAFLIESTETLQVSLKAVLNEGSDRYNIFMPLTEMILQLIVSRPLVNMIHQVIDEEGSVKDSASSELKRAREQVRSLEKKLYQLMDKLARNSANASTCLDITVVSGRWCVKVVADKSTKFDGLLLSRLIELKRKRVYDTISTSSPPLIGAGSESLVEPIFAVPLNDELQQARLSVAKAEEHVLSELTDKMLTKIDEIKKLLAAIIEIDVVIARAKYSLAYRGTFPEISISRNMDGLYTNEENSLDHQSFSAIPDSRHSQMTQNKWKVYICKAYHPLLIHQHQEKLQRAKKEISAAISELRRARLNSTGAISIDSAEILLSSLQQKVAKLEEEHPIPVDFLISLKTSMLVITGPNTGGKTISLKTIGLASLMAKSGLYVLASEPVQLPWFDAVFADIGDEQSLSQSLSTFSGHLKQINAIRLKSTCRSLVLLDEVGAGTNPLEGSALGMSLLESFAKKGALLTIATTHHGELKTLKYRNNLFENACVEFDEINLKPTYKLLWGVPGRSNAINIAERLGLPKNIVNDARKLYGTSSAKIDEVIIDMEKFKQDFQKDLQESKHYLMISKKNNDSLLVSKHKINRHSSILRTRKMQAVLDNEMISRSLLRTISQQAREFSIIQATKNGREKEIEPAVQYTNEKISATIKGDKRLSTTKKTPIEKHVKTLKVGDTVIVSSLCMKATVLKLETSKGDILVQANKMKLKLKLSDVELQK